MNFYDYFESVPVFICALVLAVGAFVLVREAIELFLDL
jgi:hypothetical protein|tara:strand:- start:324 stop:437 length:114 start_codon:yes stop_codon:yes gene_type:complete